jgi:hypothetical protein
MTTAPYDPRSGNTPDAKPLDIAGMRYQAQYKPTPPAVESKYNTERIYDRQGKLVEVYTEGPNAGRGVDTGELVIQGEAPQGTTAGVPGSGTPITGGGTTITTGGESGLSDTEKAGRQSAYDILLTEFTKYGLQSLVTTAKDLLINRTPASQIPLALQNTDAYQQRFSANQDRIKAGLRALSPAEYVSKEDALQKIMRQYGLPASYYTPGDNGKQANFDKLIANDVDDAELEDRIATAQKRVINTNPEVLKALRQFYPDINTADILAYTLDPKNAIQDINRKVTAAEIGGAALAQGLQAQGGTAEALAGQGITKAQAQQGYVEVAGMTPRGSELADIYKQGPYTQQTAEAEVFGTAGAAEAKKKRQKLASLEQASFSGSSGVGALDRDRSRYGAAYGQQGQY